ncbi:MAG TPA: right-handed parallel beta-helix repeat-containing protein [Acidimicrobiales bacterium]|nr:right-handed parallel beta-helix repeat-containing protein [Acidimicrobiales bacterium]
MNLRARKLGTLLAAGAAATLPMVAPVDAQVPGAVACGQTITQSTVLTNDVGPCPDNGIIVGADNIVLDLAGHRVFGTASSGDGAGILLHNRRGVTVQNGTVELFDGGVVILGGSGNTVTRIFANNNIGASTSNQGPASLYGDGILIQGSSGNTIVQNSVDNNGPFSGIGIITGDADHPAIPAALANDNVVQANRVTNNVACRRNGLCDNDGIRVEPRAGSGCLTGPVICPGPGNRIIGNQVVGNGLDGIALFGFTTANVVSGNTVDYNGFRGAVRGDGIRVFGSGNVIESNSASGNAAGGISVARRPPTSGSFPAGNPNGYNNRLIRNRAAGNGVVDLWDSNRNPDCDNNLWSGNTGRVAFPECTRNP